MKTQPVECKKPTAFVRKPDAIFTGIVHKTARLVFLRLEKFVHQRVATLMGLFRDFLTWLAFTLLL